MVSNLRADRIQRWSSRSLERNFCAVLDHGLVGGLVDDDQTGVGFPLDDELEEFRQVEGHAEGQSGDHVGGHAAPRPLMEGRRKGDKKPVNLFWWPAACLKGGEIRRCHSTYLAFQYRKVQLDFTPEMEYAV